MSESAAAFCSRSGVLLISSELIALTYPMCKSICCGRRVGDSDGERDRRRRSGDSEACTGNTGPELLSISDVLRRTGESSEVCGNGVDAADVRYFSHALVVFGRRTGSSGILLARDEVEAGSVFSWIWPPTLVGCFAEPRLPFDEADFQHRLGFSLALADELEEHEARPLVGDSPASVCERDVIDE
jgi:hypothetical protein